MFQAADGAVFTYTIYGGTRAPVIYDQNVFHYVCDRVIRDIIECRTAGIELKERYLKISPGQLLNSLEVSKGGLNYAKVHDSIKLLADLRINWQIDLPNGDTFHRYMPLFQDTGVAEGPPKMNGDGPMPTRKKMKNIAILPSRPLYQMFATATEEDLRSFSAKLLTLNSSYLTGLANLATMHGQNPCFKISLEEAARFYGATDVSHYRKMLMKQLKKGNETGVSPIPGFSVYFYDARSPERSLDRETKKRIPLTEQYLVLKSEEKSQPFLDLHLSDVEPYEPRILSTDMAEAISRGETDDNQ